MEKQLCSLVILSVALCSPSWAEDLIVQGKPCNTLCQAWLGVKPETPPAAAPAGVLVETDREPARRPLDHVDPPVPPLERRPTPRPSSPVEAATPLQPGASPFNAAHDGTVPSAEQGAGIPKLSSLVAVRGAIIVESPNDRAIKLKQIAALLKETTRPTPAR